MRTKKYIDKAPTEDVEQKIVALYLALKGYLYCASAGGVRTSIKQAIKMKATGYVSGVPDMAIYEPRGNYHGLFIELKRSKGGTTSPAQKEWIEQLNKRGYKAIVCKGAYEAIKAIEDYFG